MITSTIFQKNVCSQVIRKHIFLNSCIKYFLFDQKIRGKCFLFTKFLFIEYLYFWQSSFWDMRIFQIIKFLITLSTHSFILETPHTFVCGFDFFRNIVILFLLLIYIFIINLLNFFHSLGCSLIPHHILNWVSGTIKASVHDNHYTRPNLYIVL